MNIISLITSIYTLLTHLGTLWRTPLTTALLSAMSRVVQALRHTARHRSRAAFAIAELHLLNCAFKGQLSNMEKKESV